MKKILSIIIVLTMLFAFATPATANYKQSAVVPKNITRTAYEDATYSVIKIEENGTFILPPGITSTASGMLMNDGTLIVKSLFRGYIDHCRDEQKGKIIIQEDGFINVSFMDEGQAKKFASMIETDNVSVTNYGKQVVARRINRTGSVLSVGSPEIICIVGGFAAGFFVAMLIFRKKKVSTSGTEE